MLTGNREFNEIYDKYKNLVLKVAYEYSGDDYDAAQDITQETFLKLYRDFDRLKNGNVRMAEGNGPEYGDQLPEKEQP